MGPLFTRAGTHLGYFPHSNYVVTTDDLLRQRLDNSQRTCYSSTMAPQVPFAAAFPSGKKTPVNNMTPEELMEYLQKLGAGGGMSMAPTEIPFGDEEAMNIEPGGDAIPPDLMARLRAGGEAAQAASLGPFMMPQGTGPLASTEAPFNFMTSNGGRPGAPSPSAPKGPRRPGPGARPSSPPTVPLGGSSSGGPNLGDFAGQLGQQMAGIERNLAPMAQHPSYDSSSLFRRGGDAGPIRGSRDSNFASQLRATQMMDGRFEPQVPLEEPDNFISPAKRRQMQMAEGSDKNPMKTPFSGNYRR